MNNLYLIGLPGSGKTTIGRRLAAHYKREFRDLDVDIVAQAGRTIPEIFAAEGEAGFRQREADALRAVAARTGPPLVLATGGGTPCFHDNLGVLRATGFLLWLDVPLPELVRRLVRGSSSRPLLAGTAAHESPETALFEQLSRTLAARQQFYSQAHLRLAGAATAPAIVAALAKADFRPDLT
ncbi:shikimate kinase [Hymenobacter sp. BT559]|uniref:shikimate kinase n=1 Tax=Hymenobacter sp. BT559 TaxID=2795729 RepID=UPI0018EA8469|nr:shikimate kinase [Hymenobacter sp. BT559]MBJ6145814.1 shikimate kinase [Hymenobacter sp. BT559]